MLIVEKFKSTENTHREVGWDGKLFFRYPHPTNGKSPACLMDVPMNFMNSLRNDSVDKHAVKSTYNQYISGNSSKWRNFSAANSNTHSSKSDTKFNTTKEFA